MPRSNKTNWGSRKGPSGGQGDRGQGRGRGRGGKRGGSRVPTFINQEEIYREGGTLVFEGDFQDLTLDIVEPAVRTVESSTRSKVAQRGYHPIPAVFSPAMEYGGRSVHQKFIHGIGYPKGLSRSKIPISVLERDRPLLQPIKFVKGEHVKTLFEEVEEILHVPGEEAQTLEVNTLPNNIIEKIFHHDLSAQDSSDSESESDVEAETGEKPENKNEISSEEQNTVIDHTPEGINEAIKEDLVAPCNESTHGAEDFESHSNSGLEAYSATEKQTDLFIVDTSPQAVVFGPGDISFNAATGVEPLGQIPVEGEVIVYEAPNPRTSRAATNLAAGPPTFNSVSLSFTEMRDPDEVLSTTVQTHKVLGLKSTPRSRKMAKRQRSTHKKERRLSMLSIGLSHENRTVMQEGLRAKNDGRRTQRRVGDSDIDWGTEEENNIGIEEVQRGLEDMELDPDLVDIDMTTLARFANGVSGFAGDTFLTLDDLADIQRMQAENEDSDASGSLNESDEVFDASESREIGDVDILDNSESSEGEDGDGDTPRTSFQNHLKRLREQGKGKGKGKASTDDSSNEDGYGAFGQVFSWADQDESFLSNIDEIIDQKDILLRNRKSRKKMFKAIEQGNFDDISLNSTKKSKHIPDQLQAQWERDRQKKAQRKRERELARLQEAINASPSGKGKLQKKKRKLLTQGGLTFDGDTLHTGDVDSLAMLESLLRKFLASLELKTMVMPPKDKEFRRRAHSLADAYNVKSKSQGKDEKRFTTFTKTSRSGINVNQGKISSIIRSGLSSRKGNGQTTGVHIRQKDGEVVGKAAPRLNDSNIGFKLLQQMGWTEGDHIGVSGGLSDPLTAVIKTTRLGLGATHSTT